MSNIISVKLKHFDLNELNSGLLFQRRYNRYHVVFRLFYFDIMESELQKMLSGKLYLASDPELIGMRTRARLIFTAYNQVPPDQPEERKKLLSKLLGGVKSNIDVQSPFYCDYGAHIFAGENLFINFNCVILDCAYVNIGDNVMFGPNVQVYTAYHPLAASERIKGPELASPVHIGSNVWLGGGAIICPGVHIGENTTIGAGSVVTKNIPANVFAAGNPCKVIRTLDVV